MKFIIEPINEIECRITDIDCSGLQGQSVDELTIPATVEQDGKTYRVKEVGPKVCFTNKFDENTAKFAALRRLKKIVFSEGIEVIDGSMDAFGSNVDERGNGETLKEVVLPSTLKKIGARTFRSCSQLSSINIPDGLEILEEGAFLNCSSLPIFPWPKSLRIIHEDVFKEMLYPSEETEDGKTRQLPVEITIPDNIEEIKGDPYYNCYVICHVNSAKAFEVLDNAHKYENKNYWGTETSIPSIASRIIEINIPEGVRKITAPFSDLTQLSLPSTLEEIGEEAFSKLRSSQRIAELKLPESLKIIGKGAFEYAIAETQCEIQIPSSVIEIGEGAFARSNLKPVGDDTTLKRLMGQPGAFNGTLIEEIDIPEGATEVNVAECPELVQLTIPATVTNIVQIKKCPKLETLEIPDSVTKIGEISGNESLKQLRLSANLEELQQISSCDALKELRLPDSLKQLGIPDKLWYHPFSNLRAEIIASLEVWKLICSFRGSLDSYNPESGKLTIPEGVESLANVLLRDSTLNAVSLPSTLKEIGNNVFQRSRKLKSITIPAAIEKLEAETFAECEELESIDFAEGSHLKEICSEAFSKTALKQVTLPEGFTTLGGEVFKDIATLESVTFPASMTHFGFSVDKWGDTKTPFVRCKNLKQVIFLADDPATAVYPAALGKLCDWYVPDNMVDHVKAFIEKAKTEYPEVKGIGAKSVKPLSKLKGGAPEPKKKAAPKKQALTQQIIMQAYGIKAIYRFAVDEKDMPMLNDGLDKAALASRYLRDKISECSFKIVDDRSRGTTWTVEELSLKSQVNSATDKEWHCTPKTIVKLDFSDTQNLPEDFPAAIVPEVAKHGGFQNLFAARNSNFCKQLPEGAPAYLEICFSFNVIFDFMIGEKEKFNVKKITVMEDWDFESRTRRSWRFAFMYNGRYIPATSILTPEEGFLTHIFASKDADGKEKIPSSKTTVDGVEIRFDNYFKPDSLPFMNEILSLMK